MTVRCTAVAVIGVRLGAAVTCGAPGSVVEAVVAVVAVAPVVFVDAGRVVVVAVVSVALAGGTGLRASSGNSLGAIALQPNSTAIEITIARKIRFSISTGRGPNLQD